MGHCGGCGFFFFFFFCYDGCLKEEVGMAEVGCGSWLGPVFGSWLGCG